MTKEESVLDKGVGAPDSAGTGTKAAVTVVPMTGSGSRFIWPRASNVTYDQQDLLSGESDQSLRGGDP